MFVDGIRWWKTLASSYTCPEILTKSKTTHLFGNWVQGGDEYTMEMDMPRAATSLSTVGLDTKPLQPQKRPTGEKLPLV